MKAKIRAVLQQHLLALNPFNTAWEGVSNQPKLPYQSVFLTTSTSETQGIADRPLATETGFLQITLFYPIGQGTANIEQRAERIRQHYFGRSLIYENVQIIINHPPLVGGVYLVDEKLALPITINYSAYELIRE